MRSNKTTKIVMTALFAALTSIATIIIHFPSPLSGYIHLGDGLVLLSGILLGPIYGGAAAGIGSMFADIYSGYASYALATLIIKALAAVFGGFVYRLLSKAIKKNTLYYLPIIVAGIACNLVVTCGYFLFEYTIMGYGIAASANIPANILQGVFGIIVSVVLMPLLTISPFVKKLMAKEA